MSKMIIARQEQPSWVSERISYFSSKYSPAKASQTASSDDDAQRSSGDDNDKDAASAFVTATNLPFGFVTATLESATAATASVSDGDAQPLIDSGTTSPAESTSQVTSAQQTLPTMTTSISRTQSAWQSGWHSYSPASSNTASSIETDPASLSPGLQAQQKAHHGPNTTIIAGVVVPIVILLVSGLVFLTCLCRRRRRAATTTTPVVGNEAATKDPVGAPAMVEKVSEKKVDSNAPPPTLVTTMLSPIDEAMATPQHPRLVITSPQNPTYFTGLDTFSVHSAATSEDPPPPYRARSMLSHTSSERRQPSIVTNYAPHGPVSPISPVSPIAHLASPFSDSNAVDIARSPSQRSFASTLYSSNASVYEARPARRSTGPAEYVISRRSSTEDDIRVRSPFEDPENEVEHERRERRGY